MSSEYQDEVVVGVHSSGMVLEEGLNTSLSRNYCSNCKRKTHCFVTVDRETKEATINKTCTNDSCMCKCRTHYACKNCGLPHPYGEKCNRIDKSISISPESQASIIKINEQWRKLQASKQQNIPKVSDK